LLILQESPEPNDIFARAFLSRNNIPKSNLYVLLDYICS
jgi:hypothetical protein